jgi:hypothetical protein
MPFLWLLWLWIHLCKGREREERRKERSEVLRSTSREVIDRVEVRQQTTLSITYGSERNMCVYLIYDNVTGDTQCLPSMRERRGGVVCCGS